MKLSTKLMAFGAVAILAISGIAIALMSASTAGAVNDDTPIVSAATSTATTSHNLTVTVMCKVEGQQVPLAGVNVTVYTVNITKEENRTTIVIDKVAQALTDANGNATFNLPEDKYVVVATYHGLKGFWHGNLTEDQVSMVMMHNANWCQMKGHRFQMMEGMGQQFKDQSKSGWSSMDQDRTSGCSDND